MENEKEYVFTESKGIGNETIVRVKESELTKPQRELLLGEAIHRFNELPDDLKDKFMQNMFESVKKNREENPSPKLKAVKDEIYGKINQEIVNAINNKSADDSGS